MRSALVVAVLLLAVLPASADRGYVSEALNRTGILMVHGLPQCGGVFLDPDSLLTAAHCLDAEPVLSVMVWGGRASRVRATVANPARDLALVKLHQAIGIPALVSDDIYPGDAVLVIGAPAREPFVVSRGWVGKVYYGFQWDPLSTPQQTLLLNVSIWYGNSGGPVYDAHGNVVGIVVRMTVGFSRGFRPFDQVLWGWAVGGQAIKEFLEEVTIGR